MLEDINQKGFTLIELLVVIVVIGIIVGFLALAVRSAVDSAKTIGCINNLRQIYLAIEMYAQDHDGGWLYIETGQNKVTNTICSGSGKIGIGILYPNYIDDLNIYFCPANSSNFLETKSNFGINGENSNSSYGVWVYGGLNTFEQYKDMVLVSDWFFPPGSWPHRKRINKLYGTGEIKTDNNAPAFDEEP